MNVKTSITDPIEVAEVMPPQIIPARLVFPFAQERKGHLPSEVSGIGT